MLKDIPGYEGLYKVSDDGRIFNIAERFEVKASKGSSGYLLVHLRKGNAVSTKYVHRLVAMAFVANPQCLAQVNHKNEIKTDNRASNLEWVSHRDNLLYGSRLDRAIAKEKFAIEQRSIDGQLLSTFLSISEAARATGINKGNICACARGRHKTAGGFRWVLLDPSKRRKSVGGVS